MQIVSSNPSWGFFGTLQTNYGLSDQEAADLFNRTGRHLVATMLVRDPAEALEFLDGRIGRHFADALSFHVTMPCSDVEALATAVAIEVVESGQKWVKYFRKLS